MNTNIIEEIEYISRAEAYGIIAAHGWSPDEPTAVSCTGDDLPSSSFHQSFGINDFYDKAAVYLWLGY